jgi:hypothetical protein
VSLFPFNHNILHIYGHPVPLIRLITLCDVGGSSPWSVALESTSSSTSFETRAFSALLCRFMGCLWIQSTPWTQHGTCVLSDTFQWRIVCVWEIWRIHCRYCVIKWRITHIFFFFFFFFFFLSFSLLIGWQISFWNCCKPFFSLLYNCQLLWFWRLALSIVVEVFPRPFTRILLLQGCLLQTSYA